MSKKLPIKVDGQDYVLEFNRYSIKQIEAKGFNVDKLSEKLVTNIELLFHGAFIKNHALVKQRQANDIFNKLQEEYDTSDLLDVLVDLYMDALPITSDEVNEGKPKLTIVE